MLYSLKRLASAKDSFQIWSPRIADVRFHSYVNAGRCEAAAKYLDDVEEPLLLINEHFPASKYSHAGFRSCFLDVTLSWLCALLCLISVGGKLSEFSGLVQREPCSVKIRQIFVGNEIRVHQIIRGGVCAFQCA